MVPQTAFQKHSRNVEMVKQISGCQIPGCKCEEGIEYMEWNYDDLSDSEDSEWEDPGQRSTRLSVERYNL